MSESGFTFIDRLDLGKVRLEESHNLPGFHYALHGHDELYVTLTLAGTLEGAWRSGSHLRPVGSLTVIPTGAMHAMTVSEPAAAFQIIVRPSALKGLLDGQRDDIEPAVLLGGPSNRLAVRLYREFRSRSGASHLALECLLEALIDSLPARYDAEGLRARPSWLARLEELLRDTGGCERTADELAKVIGVAPATMMRGFRRHHGCTIGDYARRLRLERACRLLAHDDRAIGEIAAEVGFSDHSHLDRHFRSLLGVTPKEFRTAHARSD